MRHKFSLLHVPAAILFLVITSCSSEAIKVSDMPIKVQLDTLVQFMDFDMHGIAQPGDIALLENGDVVVADGKIKKITIVDPEGNLLAQFGKEGKGPAEFIRPGQIMLTSDYINVVDASQYKVLEYDYEGSFVDSYTYKSKAFNQNIALTNNRVYYTGSGGENNSLIKFIDINTDSSFLFGSAKGEAVENLDMEASRNDFMNGRIPAFFKNNTNVVIGNNHIYAFLDSYSELRKYDMNGNLIWDKIIELPDNEQLLNQISDMVKSTPNALPFLRYTLDIKPVNEDIYLLGGKTFDNPQHLTKIDSNGEIRAIYQMPNPDYYFGSFAVNPINQTIYLSSVDGMVYKGKLNE
ncbi:MAG: 6-bladed beta-propeller [Balneolaceae bacterium]